MSFLREKKTWLAAGFMWLAAVGASAQCVVGGTGFETSKPLFNPTLTNDEEGWYSADLGDLLDEQCGTCNYFSGLTGIAQKGIAGNLSTAGSSTPSWTQLKAMTEYKTGGFAAVTANPRVISPFLNEGSGSNMLVAIGNTHESAFFTYSVNGLAPSSSVTLTVDIYSLLSPEYLEQQLIAMNQGVEDRVDLKKEIAIANNLKFSMQNPNGLTLTQPAISGNKANITIAGDVKYGQPQDPKVSTGDMDWGDKKSLTLKATTDANGSVTFYFLRAAGANFAPIGIDNIKLTGSIAPVVTSPKKGDLCAGNQVRLAFKQSYPSDTKYSWSCDGQESFGPTFAFTPKEINKDYTVMASVLLDGCAEMQTTFNIHTKECCPASTDANGNTVAMTENNIFYDDFGMFLDANTYEYTDAKGNVHTIPTTGIYGDGDEKRCVTVLQPGTKVSSAIDPCTDKRNGSRNLNEAYAITNINPYNPGVNGDASGDKRGGMFVVDLSGSTCNSVPVENLVIYEREVCGMCAGKEIHFSAQFGSLNNKPNVGDIAVVLTTSGGRELMKNTIHLTSSSEWQEVPAQYTMQEGDGECVVMQVINVSPNLPGDGYGDYAIDDIRFTVCSPPDIEVTTTMSDQELLDLCEDKPLVLTSKMENATGAFAGEVGYLFQYSYKNPLTTSDDDMKDAWEDLSAVQSDGEFTIDVPKTHFAFRPLLEDKTGTMTIYFRVVVGLKSYLENERSKWVNMSPQSPCRAVSISTIPIIAKLNCQVCTDPDPVIFGADGGLFTKTQKKVELCDGDETELSMANEVHGIDSNNKDYYDFTVTWYKETVSPATVINTANTGKIANHRALTVPVKFNDASAAGTKYIISIKDNYDASCSEFLDTIIVIANPAPAGTLDPVVPFCEGKLTVEPAKSLPGMDLIWYTAEDTTVATTTTTDAPVVADAKAEDSPIKTFYVVKDKTTGCRSDVNTYTITVNPIPEEDLAPIADFCEGDATAKLPTSAKGYTVKWYKDALKTATAETNLASLTGSTTAYDYWYTLTDESETTNCESDPVKYSFTVKPIATISLAATPECDLTTITATVVPATATITWTPASTTATGNSVLVDDITNMAGTYSAVASATGYCDSDPDEITVTVNTTPDPITVTVPDYLKSDGTPDFSKIDALAAAKKSADADVTIQWSALSGPTLTDESATMTTAPAAGYTATRQDPTPNMSNTDDEFYYYWVRQVRSNTDVASCPSTATLVKVPVLGAPSPNVHDTVVCLNSPRPLTLGDLAKVNQAKEGVFYELVWEDASVSETTKPDLSAVTKLTYNVAQRVVGTTNTSAYKTFTISVIGVNPPTVAGDIDYCAGDLAVPVNATLSKDDISYFATGIKWFEDDVEQTATPTPNTDVDETTVYHYAAVQNYTIPSSGEVCYGDSATFNVTVTFVPAPEPKTYSYVVAEGNNGRYPSISTKGWVEDPAYEYSYRLVGETSVGSLPPSPVCTEDLNGSTKTIKYEVWRKKKGTECSSKPEIITIEISDALPPVVADVKYCEGEPLQALTAKKNPQVSAGKTDANYTLLWYGTNKPVDTTDPNFTEADSYPLTGAATVTTNATTTTSYWVAQRDDETNAVSNAVEIKVIVYPTPVLSVTDPAAVCKTDNPTVDVAAAGITDVINKVTEPAVTYTPSYFTDAAGTTALAPTAVGESGTYYVQMSYNAQVNSGAVCKSAVEPINVTIDTLMIISKDTRTCPDQTATFVTEVKTNAASFSGTWSDGQSDTKTFATSPYNFETRAFVGVPEKTTLNYTVTVNAGACTNKSKQYSVYVGEGPVEGTLILSDATNKKEPTRDILLNDEPFYFCGGNVTVTPTLDGDADYELETPSGSKLTTAPFSVNEAGVYVLRYTNMCPTSVRFILKDASISVTNTTPELTMCETSSFTSKLTVTNKDPEYAIVWKKDGNAIVGETTNTYTISSTTTANNGHYTAEVSSHGCENSTEIGDLLVKAKIVAAPLQDLYIVTRGESQDVNIATTVPANSVTLANVEWFDNGVATGVNGKAYTESNVQKDHKYTIKLSDPDFCDGETSTELKVDALLQITSQVADVQCEGSNYTMTIDTTGTGKAYKTPAPKVSVFRTTASQGKTDITAEINTAVNPLQLAMTAVEDAKYQILFTYADQQPKDTTISVRVIPAIKVNLPATPTICEGEEIELTVSVIEPLEGTTITWEADPNMKGQTDGKATLTPVYNAVTGVNHSSVYSYTVSANNSICNDTKMYTVTVNVDEPLNGKLTAESPICEGKTSTIDASEYQATTYNWTADGTGTISSSATTQVTPAATTTYNVAMTRGKCEANDNIEVKVTSRPEIVAMDSIGVRAREVKTAPSKGTGVFYYWLDGNSNFTTTETMLYDLNFGSHTIHVKDEVGCENQFQFSLEAPVPVIPPFFTPNGDGLNDNWIVTTLAEVYPNAVIKIFDRFGKVVAEFLGADADGWDGTYKGHALPSTDYWYMIDIEEIDRQYTGHFTLLRR